MQPDWLELCVLPRLLRLVHRPGVAKRLSRAGAEYVSLAPAKAEQVLVQILAQDRRDRHAAVLAVLCRDQALLRVPSVADLDHAGPRSMSSTRSARSSPQRRHAYIVVAHSALSELSVSSNFAHIKPLLAPSSQASAASARVAAGGACMAPLRTAERLSSLQATAAARAGKAVRIFLPRAWSRRRPPRDTRSA